MAHWNEEQHAYWDRIAPGYESLYQSRWSLLEDSYAVELLREIAVSDKSSTLDLGAGTGLGHALLQSAGFEGKYHARDVSPLMIHALLQRVPTAVATVGPMDDLALYSGATFDLVVSLNTSCSFARSPVALLEEIHRVLRPNGVAVLSFLGRRSLGFSRLLFHALLSRYSTRNAASTLGSTPAWFVSPRIVAELLVDAGMTESRLHSYSLFRGRLESPALWPLDQWLCRKFPSFGGVLYSVSKKA